MKPTEVVSTLGIPIKSRLYNIYNATLFFLMRSLIIITSAVLNILKVVKRCCGWPQGANSLLELSCGNSRIDILVYLVQIDEN